MAIVLEILKWIGIILLCILGLVLLLVLLTLFAPITYNVRAQGSKDYVKVVAKMGMLLWIIRPIVIFEDNELKIKLRIFGIPIKISGYDKKEKAPGKAKKEKAGTTSTVIVESEEEVQYNVTDSEALPEVVDDTPLLEADAELETELSHMDAFDKNDSINVEPKKEGLTDKLKGILKREKKPKGPKLSKEEKAKLKEEAARLKAEKKAEKKAARQEKIKKLKDLKAKAEEVIAILKKEETKQAIRLVKDVIKKILRHICPRRFKGHAHIGFEDPSTTGTILAVVGGAYPIHHGNIGITPCFDTDEMIFEGDVKVGGHVFLIYFVIQGLRILRNKTIMGLIKKARQA